MTESSPQCLEIETVRHVAGTCLCLHTQRAARALARLFDTALAPYGLTHGQFSLLMALNGPNPQTISRLADFLAMDRTSLTAALKPLERKGLLHVTPSKDDKRARIITITPAGVAVLGEAVHIWRHTHGLLDAALAQGAPDRLRADLRLVPASAAAVATP
ncbi:MAG: MarR family transcriptional regulator [Phyllobacteriaceae bacterium]|nr:MarR family transcriptional regulator [Phyllobacteriaceae bacterium]